LNRDTPLPLNPTRAHPLLPDVLGRVHAKELLQVREVGRELEHVVVERGAGRGGDEPVGADERLLRGRADRHRPRRHGIVEQPVRVLLKDAVPGGRVPHEPPEVDAQHGAGGVHRDRVRDLRAPRQAVD
jgi:hypothetical protein